jgi:hypothetical protein
MARPRKTASMKAADLTIAELRRLLAVKEKMVTLEAARDKLRDDLARVEAEIRRVEVGGAAPRRARPARRRRKPGRKPGRPAAPKRAARRAAKKAGRKVTKRAAGGKRPAKGTLQDVVAGLIRSHGGPMSFQDILRAIMSRKLVKTRSKNFANVLRRTLSTSKTIKRVARGTYGV